MSRENYQKTTCFVDTFKSIQNKWFFDIDEIFLRSYRKFTPHTTILLLFLQDKTIPFCTYKSTFPTHQ